MMSPAVTRTELNNSDDIIREVGLDRPPRRVNKLSKAGSFNAACSGKAPFTSRSTAEIAAPRGTTIYRCPYCRNWHVGRVKK